MGKSKNGKAGAPANPLAGGKSPAYPDFDLDDPDFPKELEERALASGGYPYDKKLKREPYEEQLQSLQVEFIKLQAYAEEAGERIVVVFEGRDTSGKGGCISRILERINPRHSRSVALSSPRLHTRKESRERNTQEMATMRCCSCGRKSLPESWRALACMALPTSSSESPSRPNSRRPKATSGTVSMSNTSVFTRPPPSRERPPPR